MGEGEDSGLYLQLPAEAQGASVHLHFRYMTSQFCIPVPKRRMAHTSAKVTHCSATGSRGTGCPIFAPCWCAAWQPHLYF